MYIALDRRWAIIAAVCLLASACDGSGGMTSQADLEQLVLVADEYGIYVTGGRAQSDMLIGTLVAANSYDEETRTSLVRVENGLVLAGGGTQASELGAPSIDVDTPCLDGAGWDYNDSSGTYDARGFSSPAFCDSTGATPLTVTAGGETTMLDAPAVPAPIDGYLQLDGLRTRVMDTLEADVIIAKATAEDGSIAARSFVPDPATSGEALFDDATIAQISASAPSLMQSDATISVFFCNETTSSTIFPGRETAVLACRGVVGPALAFVGGQCIANAGVTMQASVDDPFRRERLAQICPPEVVLGGEPCDELRTQCVGLTPHVSFSFDTMTNVFSASADGDLTSSSHGAPGADAQTITDLPEDTEITLETADTLVRFRFERPAGADPMVTILSYERTGG